MLLAGLAPASAEPDANAKAEKSPEMENVRRAIEALTPEQRRRFRENFKRWADLSSDEKRTLRDRDQVRKKRMVDEIDEAIRESGLTLTPEQRERYGKRYAQERRPVEEMLRRESEEKRKPLVQALVEKLKGEFAGGQGVIPPAEVAK